MSAFAPLLDAIYASPRAPHARLHRARLLRSFRRARVPLARDLGPRISEPVLPRLDARDRHEQMVGLARAPARAAFLLPALRGGFRAAGPDRGERHGAPAAVRGAAAAASSPPRPHDAEPVPATARARGARRSSQTVFRCSATFTGRSSTTTNGERTRRDLASSLSIIHEASSATTVIPTETYPPRPMPNWFAPPGLPGISRGSRAPANPRAKQTRARISGRRRGPPAARRRPPAPHASA